MDSKIFWNSEKNFGIVDCPKGNIWNTIGVFNSGKAYVYADEAFYLAEFHGFEIANKSNVLGATSAVKLSCNALFINDLDSELVSYKLFKTLKKHGYILLRPESKYFTRSRLFEMLRAEYSLFKPSSTFKKSNPSGLIGRIFEVKPLDKVGFIIDKIEKNADTSILAISDEMNGFFFLAATVLCPISNHSESSNILSKQSKSQLSSVN